MHYRHKTMMVCVCVGCFFLKNTTRYQDTAGLLKIQIWCRLETELGYHKWRLLQHQLFQSCYWSGWALGGAFFYSCPSYLSLRLAADCARSSSSLSTDYGSWQIVSGCGSIHDHAHFPPPLASASSSNSSTAIAAYDSPLPFSFQDEASGRM